MVTLYHFMRIWGIPDGSPFCVKLETYLRMANIEYKADPTFDVRKAPKKKFPLIEHKGKLIADSSLIIDYLKKEFGDEVDKHLNDDQKAQCLCLQRLVEEHLYWIVLYLRWAPDESWAQLKPSFFGQIPFPFKLFVPDLIRKQMLRYMQGQGISRHSYDEINEIGKADLIALATILGDKPYFMGDQPSTIDASVFGLTANVIYCPINSPIKEFSNSLANLVDHCQRMKTQYFPELSKDE